MSEYLYFNKTTFKALIKLWRKVVEESGEELDYLETLKTDDELIELYIPLKFIHDIDTLLYHR